MGKLSGKFRLADHCSCPSEQMSRFVDDIFITSIDAGVVNNHCPIKGSRCFDITIGKHLQITPHFQIITLNILWIDTSEHIGGVWINGDHRLDSVPFKHREHRLRMFPENTIHSLVMN